MGLNKYIQKCIPPTRFWIGVMMFLACFINYSMRVNFSLNLIAMVNPTYKVHKKIVNYGPRYPWSEKDQASLLGAFFYGYLALSIPGGLLAERVGGTIVIGTTLIGCSILTAFIPLAARFGVTMVFVIRFFTGVFAGATFPACHNLISQWAPPDERGKFVASLMGGTFGIVLTMPISAIVVENFGWDWAFYAVAIFSLIICVIWFLVVADNPAKHRTISIEEKNYIESSLRDNLSKTKNWPPCLRLMTSVPFIALIFLHFGNLWGLSFLITSAPKFLNEIFDFKLSEAGSLLSLPHLSRILLAFMFGSIVDAMRRHNFINPTLMRKLFCIFSHIIPGLLLILIAIIEKNPHYCVLIMSLSLGFNGAATVTNLQNSQDLAPNYAGTLYGIINFIGMTSGFISPLVVAAFTSDENDFDHWKYTFIIGGAIYILTAIIFIIFGTANVQPWNFDDNDEQTAEKENKNATNKPK